MSFFRRDKNQQGAEQIQARNTLTPTLPLRGRGSDQIRGSRVKNGSGLKMRVTAATLAVGVMLSGMPGLPGVMAAEPAAAEAEFVELTPDVKKAISRGLAYLASTQQASGNFGQSGYDVAVTSLACLAFMADGNLPGRGEYGTQVEKGLNYVLSCCGSTGLVAGSNAGSPMYGHGFATLFLGEVYGMTNDPRVRDALIRSVRLIVNAQNSEGGWRYTPMPLDADVSVTICQIMALRSAKEAGIGVPKETIDKAVAYVKRCQNMQDGGFNYTASGGGSAFPRSAAGVASLFYAGIYEGDSVKLGLEYLKRSKGDNSYGHFQYGHYYASQAMFLAGGKYWRDWYPKIRSEFVAKQNTDGSWDGDVGREYGTAMSVLVVIVPNRYLPIFQR
jgi:hypothetical protein